MPRSRNLRRLVNDECFGFYLIKAPDEILQELMNDDFELTEEAIKLLYQHTGLENVESALSWMHEYYCYDLKYHHEKSIGYPLEKTLNNGYLEFCCAHGNFRLVARNICRYAGGVEFYGFSDHIDDSREYYALNSKGERFVAYRESGNKINGKKKPDAWLSMADELLIDKFPRTFKSGFYQEN